MSDNGIALGLDVNVTSTLTGMTWRHHTALRACITERESTYWLLTLSQAELRRSLPACLFLLSRQIKTTPRCEWENPCLVNPNPRPHPNTELALPSSENLAWSAWEANLISFSHPVSLLGLNVTVGFSSNRTTGREPDS